MGILWVALQRGGQQVIVKLSDILKIPISGVSVKATTTEQLGFTGRREGIVAQAITSILLPASKD